jgi:hypothetical protein
MEIKSVDVIVPAGQYVLGDPCYAVPDEHWDDLLASCDYFHSPVGYVNVGYTKKFRVLGFGTRWGDGCYAGSDGKEYPVDAGLIGLVPIELVEDVSEHYGNIVTFNKDTICSSNGDGKLRFGSIIIDTDPEEETDEDNY